MPSADSSEFRLRVFRHKIRWGRSLLRSVRWLAAIVAEAFSDLDGADSCPLSNVQWRS